VAIPGRLTWFVIRLGVAHQQRGRLRLQAEEMARLSGPGGPSTTIPVFSGVPVVVLDPAAVPRAPRKCPSGRVAPHTVAELLRCDRSGTATGYVRAPEYR
jgi:hypothetical protein